MPDGTASLAEAFASAESELGGAASDESAASLLEDGLEEDASAANTQDASDGDTLEGDSAEGDLDLTGLEDLIDGGDDAAPIDPTSPEFLETTVVVDTVSGPESVTIAELKRSYLRTADYTRKTQELAERREEVKQAVELFNAFTDAPEEFARTLAVRAGLIEEGAEPIKKIDAIKIPTAEDLEAEVDRRVQEALQSDPTVQQARLAAAREAVRGEFAKIEQTHGVTLNDKQRQAVIAEATKRGTTDLELVFEAMLSRLRNQRSRKNAAPARPTGSPGSASTDSDLDAPPSSIAEAMKQAEAILAGA